MDLPTEHGEMPKHQSASVVWLLGCLEHVLPVPRVASKGGIEVWGSTEIILYAGCLRGYEQVSAGLSHETVRAAAWLKLPLPLPLPTPVDYSL